MAAAPSHFHGKLNFPKLPSSNPSHLLAPPFRPIRITMARDTSYWASIESDIETHLKKSIPIRPPVSVFEPMHHLTFAAPRTTAPALCIAACELVGGRREQAMAAASAIHLVNAAAYTHKHLPLTDRPKRKPKICHAFGPNIELLTGDGIMPFGLQLLAQSDNPAQNTSDRILRVIIEISRAAGSGGMVDGQYRKMLRSQTDGEKLCEGDWIEYVCEKTEGELHACGAACGGILGGGSEEEIKKLRRYGLYVGMIQGMMYGMGRNGKEKTETVEKLGALAVKELESFRGRNAIPISSLAEEAILCSVQN